MIIEALGLGFYVHIPASFYFQAPSPGDNITVYTYLQVKDDRLVLYGFRNNEERDFFKTLLGVSGIGPKIALALLGHLALTEIAGAVMQEDMTVLTSIPGIGKKTARRLIYELKDKFKGWQLDGAAGGTGGIAENWQDVQQALAALDYSTREINRAKNELATEENLSMEELFKKALLFLAKH